MASRDQKTHIKQHILAFALLSILISAFVFPAQAYALGEPNSLPNLITFIESIKDGSPDSLRGIYVEGVMAFPIVQQPMGNPGYVSAVESTVTQFSIASEVGNIGLLAHNHLAGINFSLLKQGDTITLIYGDGHTERFLVENVRQYQALSPLSPYSEFKDLGTESILTAEQLFNDVYRGDFHLTLQTCIENEGNLSWGRLFIIAKPAGDKSNNALNQKYNSV